MKRDIPEKSKLILKQKWGITSRLRVPSDEPYTPGLRRPVNTHAIGFLANLHDDTRDD